MARTSERLKPPTSPQAALSVLDGFGGPLAAAIANLEELAIKRGQAGDVPYPALDAAIAAAGAMQASQQSRAQALENALGT